MLQEHGITLEHVQHMSQAAFGLAVLAMAFRKDIRYEVRRRQGNICDCCGEKVDKLQTHHRRPESLGGASSRIENAVGVCQDCHKVLDVEAFQGTLYPQVHTQKEYYPQGNGL